MVAHTDFANTLKHPDRFFIDGEWVSPSTDAQIEVVSPSSEEIFYRVAQALPADVDRTVTAARAAFDDGPWPRLSPAERADYLRKIAHELRKRANELGGLWSGEMGSLYAANQRLIPIFADVYDFHASMADTFPFIEPRQPAQGGAGYLVREPVGVVAAIVPWNGPLMLASWKTAPALLAGCTVILKASPEAPGTLYALAEAAEAAGLPRACSTSSPRTGKRPSCWCAIRASTRSALPDRPRRDARSGRSAPTALRAARSNWVASRPPSSWTTMIWTPSHRRSPRRRPS